VFKRREKLSWGRWLAEGVYPRAGWKRASAYIAHRIRRLPDTPYRIAKGLGVGVVISFTPIFGFHFLLAALLAVILRGNVLAALLGTFFGNPVSFPFIATMSIQTGRILLGRDRPRHGPNHENVLELFGGAFSDFYHNFLVMFRGGNADWHGLSEFFFNLFLPYLIGGIVPGMICGFVVFYVSRPLIQAYQNRRKGRLLARWTDRRKKSEEGAGTPDKKP